MAILFHAIPGVLLTVVSKAGKKTEYRPPAWPWALMPFRITRVMTVCFRNQTVRFRNQTGRFRNQHGLIPENARSDFGIGTV